LQSIGPILVEADGNIATLLSEAAFANLAGNGVLQIISAPQSGPLSGGQPIVGTLSVFVLSNGTYTQSSVTFNVFASFVRNTGKPTAVVRNFSVANPTAQYQMTIINGDNQGRNLVSSAEISLNGVVVAGPNVFNQQVKTLKIPVAAAMANTLSVTLKSAPGSQLSIGIGPQP